MCREDILLGRAMRGYQVTTTLSAASAVEIMPEDKNRTCIIIGSPTSGTLFFGHDPLLTATTGVPLPTSFPPIVLNVKDHGEVVTGKLFGIASAGTPTVTIIAASLHLAEWIKWNERK